MTSLEYPQTQRWLNLPLEMQDESGIRYARIVTAIIIALFCALLTWAAVAPIDETANASGQIVPASPISDVHHLEGGIVDSVFVKEGDHVQPGQVLITLRPEQTASDYSQLEARLAGLQLKSIRLAASLAEREPDFGPLGERFPQLRDEQRLAYRQNVAQAREERQQLQIAVERTGEQLKTAKEEAKSLTVQVELQVRLTALRQKSNEMGYTSLPVVLQTQTSLEESRQHLISANGRIAELTRMYDEARAKLQQAIAERLRKLTEERADTGAQLSETQAALEKYADRMRRLEVRAPIEGIVHGLANAVTGEVVKPGGLVAQIVPGRGGIVAEVEMDPRDVGHVRVGNDAEIRMSNYDPNVFGVVTGNVRMVSATTFETKDGRPFYRVRIGLHRDHVSAGKDERPLMPGMTLQAQIKTSSKSLLRYLLKPIYQSLNTAFSER